MALQGNPELTSAVEDLRRETFALIERASADAVTADGQRAVVALQRIAYELGCVETLLGDGALRAA